MTKTITFPYTGGQQTFTVPSSMNSLTVTACGASGYNGYGNGGAGGCITCPLTVTPLATLYVYVGGSGGSTGGGYNGGGSGGSAYGGGATDIRSGGTALSNRVVVGGGGGAGTSGHCGGNANYPVGSNGCSGAAPAPTGGSQSSGGAGASWSGYTSASGSLGNGGSGASGYPSGGGGGGYYGGGGGIDGGAGGSSYCSTTMQSQSTNSGNGHLSFTVTASPHVVSLYFSGLDNSHFGRKGKLLPAIKRSVTTVLGVSPRQLKHIRILSEAGQLPSAVGTRVSMLICAYDADYGTASAIDVLGLKILDSISLGTMQSNITSVGGDISLLTAISYSNAQSPASALASWTC